MGHNMITGRFSISCTSSTIFLMELIQGVAEEKSTRPCYTTLSAQSTIEPVEGLERPSVRDAGAM